MAVATLARRTRTAAEAEAEAEEEEVAAAAVGAAMAETVSLILTTPRSYLGWGRVAAWLLGWGGRG